VVTFSTFLRKSGALFGPAIVFGRECRKMEPRDLPSVNSC
jgi:hypothetical protein